MERALKWIAAEYHDLNGTHYDTLEGPPSSLDFSRLVHVARPVVIKNCSLPGYDTASWTNEFLIQQMGDRNISVAATPNGHADAVTLGPDGRLILVELVLRLDPSDARETSSSGREVLYLQSQNGNMYTSRYFDLNEDSLVSEAIDKPPDAVNLWIGNERSVTSIHSDPYENIYTVVRGAKHFTLLPPTEGWCMKERLYPHAAYIRSPTRPN
ncbi:JmjC domain-containing protein 7 [Grifola frondosa]|uniref:JmjC domain-containing protein 7 n=1 Tax=Grifola frondosa TaxID=5627 RepID=A0A1C7MK02_GRIFR|nr:JmjC domain-containing protein 7 [Grifola frondosa]